MPVTNDTVHDRIERVRIELAPVQVVLLLVLVAAVGYTLLFLQEPLVHDSLHNVRHAMGVTCH